MQKPILTLFFAFSFLFPHASRGAEAAAPSIKEASLITEVLPRGETITAVRLEYSEEIYSVEAGYEVPGQETNASSWKYRLPGHSILNVYVNNSGKKADVGLYGKFVFLDLDTRSNDSKTYRAQDPSNAASRVRPQVPAYVVNQIRPVATRSGKAIPPLTISTTREICEGMDDYKTFAFKNEATGHTLYYHLYIPKGYESKSASAKNLPLVVHYPATDYAIADWTGKYRGAMFTHHDALYWSDEESQSENPAFVVTVGGPADPKWGADFSQSEMQQNYFRVIQKILSDFNVDASRIYGVSLAGGSPAMWNTLIANPTLFAAQISTSYDPYHAYRDAKVAEEKLAILLKTAPAWFFAGLNDPTGTGILGAADTRLKGERLRDIAAVMNRRGFNVDVAYGKEGELMWNGLLRGEQASQLAEAQLVRAKARSSSHLVTLYIPGTIPGNPHLSWDATYSNAVVRRWLFQQARETTYHPGK
jgi:predicted peptidase